MLPNISKLKIFFAILSLLLVLQVALTQYFYVQERVQNTLPIMDSIKKKEYSTIESLIKANNTLGEMKYSLSSDRVLHYAVRLGDLETVRILLQNGTDPDVMGANGTAIYYAIQNNDIAMCEILLSYGASVNTTGYRHNDTPLHTASALCYPAIVHLLLKNGALIDVRNMLKETPLILAAQNGCSDAVIILLESGADLDAEDKFGKKAIDYAREQEHKEIYRILLLAEND